MGYTIEKGKIVIWTTKEFVSNEWPFQDCGENWTMFYKNLKDRKPFRQTLAVTPEEEKKKIVAEELGLAIGSFILKSKKSHFKNKSKNW